MGDHPRSYGFPPGHPPMETFLGVPVMIRGASWGNLHLTDREDGRPFSAADEEALTILASWAAIAIDDARLYADVAGRRQELERAVRGLEATAAIARAVGGETDLGRILELIVKRGRALVDAEGMLILLRDGADLVVAATAGTLPADLQGTRLPSAEPWLGTLGLDPDAALTVPLVFRGRSLGVLADSERLPGAVEEAIGQLDERIDALRGLIRELRPAALDELGDRAAIEDLAARVSARHGVTVTTDLAFADGTRHPGAAETALYRIIQEALTNAVEHAAAEHVEVVVTEDGGHLRVRVSDDGGGFDPAAATTGFGLMGMRERVALLGGDVRLASSPDGTTVAAVLPARAV